MMAFELAKVCRPENLQLKFLKTSQKTTSQTTSQSQSVVYQLLKRLVAESNADIANKQVLNQLVLLINCLSFIWVDHGDCFLIHFKLNFR